MATPFIRPARNRREFDQAYQLEARIFGPTPRAAARRRRANEALDPIRLNETIVAVDGDEIAGLVRILPRTLTLAGASFKTGAITHVCTASPYRGTGLGRRLMEEAVKIMIARGFILSATIARKAVDDFYPLFGYVGVDAFARQTCSPPLSPSKKLSLRPGPSSRRLQLYRRLYRTSYGAVGLSFIRTPLWWKDLAKRLRSKHPHLRWLDIESSGKFIGYALVDTEGVVLEAASALRHTTEALATLSRKKKPHEIVLQLPPAHSWMPTIRACNHTAHTRAAWNGGHLVRVLAPKKIFSHLTRVALKKETSSSIAQLRRFQKIPPSHHARLREALAFCSQNSLPEILRPVWGALDEF